MVEHTFGLASVISKKAFYCRPCYIMPIVTFRTFITFTPNSFSINTKFIYLGFSQRIISNILFLFLLGIYEKGAVEVTNCLCIPHNESEDEVAVDMEFAKAMYELQKKVNSSEVIVGWYATGADVTGHSVLIHDYYSREANNPIHLTVDTSLSEGSLTWKAFTSTSFGVPGKNTGTMFTPCKVEIVGYEPEFVGMKIAQQTKHNKQRSVEILPDLDMISNAIQNMLELSDVVIGYIDDVLVSISLFLMKDCSVLKIKKKI
ncbi:UNVERIFIED_CONTAM: eIF3-S5-1 [Trichonephila clavipes]